MPRSFVGALDMGGRGLCLGAVRQTFVGLIDGVKIRKRALPPAEIQRGHWRNKHRAYDFRPCPCP